MRIIFVGSCTWTNTGYGKPMRYLLPRLQLAGYELALCPFYGYDGPPTMATAEGQPIRILPRAKDVFFNDMIEFHVTNWQADAVISLCDVWVLNKWGTRGFPWLPRFPIDTHPISKGTLEAIEGCHTPLALTKFGQQELFDNGWPTARYIPHGVDLDIYRPMDRAEARERAGLPPDAFVAGMIASNASEPSRKSFPEVLQAWRGWLDRGGEGYLYLHTTISPKTRNGVGVDLIRLLDTLELTGCTLDAANREHMRKADVLFPSQYGLWTDQFTDEKLADLYGSFDVLLSPSRAEGFGIPIIEAQACGVPVITNAVTSMPELTFAGKALPPAQMAWSTRKEGIADAGWRGVADVDALTDAIHWAYALGEGKREELAAKARAGASQFGWDHLVKAKWLPLLRELEAWLG